MKKLAKILCRALLTVTAVASLTVLASAIELKTGIGTVTTGLRLRAEANTSCDVLNVANAGDKVVVISEKDGWYLVDYNLQIGYMSAEYVDFSKTSESSLGVGRVAYDAVNVRSEPSSDSTYLTTIYAGNRVPITGFSYGWYRVNANGYTGYVRSDLLELVEAPSVNGSSSVSTASVSSSGAPAASSASVYDIIAYAKNFIGVPYVWGGTTPYGFDCSGFIQYVASHFGYTIGRTAQEQSGYGPYVSYGNLQAGDVIFFTNTYSSYDPITHVAIYIGDGNFIHCCNRGVTINNLSENYYGSRYYSAARIFR